MSSVAEAKRDYYKSLGLDGSAVADLEAAYYEGAVSGATPVAPLASTTVAGIVKKAAAVPAAAVPFADLTAAANAYNALRTSLINAGVLSST